eukprot:2913761-Amphidinium_carterae.1
MKVLGVEVAEDVLLVVLCPCGGGSGRCAGSSGENSWMKKWNGVRELADADVVKKVDVLEEVLGNGVEVELVALAEEV